MLHKFCLTILLGCLLSSCKADTDLTTLPPQLESLDNVDVISLSSETEDSVYFEKDITFGDRPIDSLYVGNIGDFVIDDEGNVYIVDRGQIQIHVYDQYGAFISSIGSQGRGPGELIGIESVGFIANNLFVHDPGNSIINLYSTETLELIDSKLVSMDSWQATDSLNGHLGYRYYGRRDGTYLARFIPFGRLDMINNDYFESYYILDSDLNIISGKVFETQLPERFTVNVGNQPLAGEVPFQNRDLSYFSDDGTIYTANSDEFIIKTLDSNGIYQRALYYPYAKAPIHWDRLVDQLIELNGESTQSYYRNIENPPETWPAIDNFFVDDEERFWISTIVDSNDYYEWWVVDNSVSLLATFQWPAKRLERSVLLNSETHNIKVKNGFLYSLEKNSISGTQEIVRYEIHFSIE